MAEQEKKSNKTRVLFPLKQENKNARSFPKSIFFILGNEFCERFCFYGMRSILAIYLTHRLYYSDDIATVIFHLFVSLSYFTPILGAVIADTWFGKFRTIFCVSILYCLGNAVLSSGSFPNSLGTMRAVSILGLVVIGIGTGGIKPCVSAFGGDQFHSNQIDQREHFFSIFYFLINVGSLFSTLLTPVLREDVQCLGENTCYPLAFGVPGILMVIAVVLFIVGKSMYIIKEPEGNLLPSVLGCIFHAIVTKCRSSQKKKNHWLDYAEDKYDKDLIADIKILLHVLVLYLPIPFFWALFDQTGSRWTLQATKLNGELFGEIVIKPDQMQAANPIFIIIFIPLFQYAIYPLLERCNLLTKPLQRMTVGGFLAAGAFIIAGILELALGNIRPDLPKPGFSELDFINLHPCTINISGPKPHHHLLRANEMKSFKELVLNQKDYWTFSTIAGETSCISFKESYEIVYSSPIRSALLVTLAGKFHIQIGEDNRAELEMGQANVRVFFAILNFTVNSKFKFEGHKTYLVKPSYETIEKDYGTYGRTSYTTLEPGKYKFYLPPKNNNSETQYQNIGQFHFHSGGNYIVGTVKNDTYLNLFLTTIQSLKSVHILWQIPQYVVITAAEIMLSITGLQFSYTQAPLSMKSVLQAAWLLTVAFGNLIVTIEARVDFFEKKYWEFFMFAAAMALDMLVFGFIAYFYKYVTIKTYSQDEMEQVH